MCYADKEEGGFIEPTLFKSIVDQLPENIKRVALGLSGEVFMHPKFDEYIRYLKATHPMIWVGMNTNGMLIRDHLDTIALLDSITVSLDGFEESNDRQRRGANYWTIHDGIEAILKLPKRPRLRLNMVVTDLNREEINDYYAYWYPKVDEVNFSLCFSEEGVIEEGTWSPTRLPARFCHKSFAYMGVRWNGLVVPCCHDLNIHNSMGDVNTQTLLEVWGGDRFKTIRRECASRKYVKFPHCKKCQLWKLNPLKTFFRNPDPTI
jgi:radical SAM protein with 4Fe4S-binding SPASM domain